MAQNFGMRKRLDISVAFHFSRHCHVWQEEAPSPRLADLLSN
jgi:hypothetical protein